MTTATLPFSQRILGLVIDITRHLSSTLGWYLTGIWMKREAERLGFGSRFHMFLGSADDATRDIPMTIESRIELRNFNQNNNP